MLNIVKNTTLPTLLDLLIPLSCRGCGLLGSALCECCKNNIILNRKNYCPNCKEVNPTGKCKNCPSLPPIFVVDKRENLIGELIHNFKYDSNRALARSLAEILNGVLPAIDDDVVIVPLPTITPHIRARGFDHTHLIAKRLAKLRGKKYCVKKILTRLKNTVQVGADGETRLKQSAKAYGINKNINLDPKATYLLFDDVWTTGASMKTALEKLRSAGAKKIIITVLAVNSLN